MRAIPLKDIAPIEVELAPGDVAPVIILLNGLSTAYLQQVRDIPRKHGVVLIFDEVVTGFRYAPGGAQEYFGVTPDLTTHAKILAGGYPGGSVSGRADIMGMLEHRDDPTWQRYKRVSHPGTFNANPVSAPAAAACLNLVNPPLVHEYDPFGLCAREQHHMRDDDHRHAFVSELSNHAQHLADQLRIQGRRRLVEEHDLRLHGQRPRDRAALLLTAR